MSLRELAEQEYINWKERMHKETVGVYVLYYVGLIFTTIISIFFGLDYEKEDYSVLLTYAVLIGLMYHVFTMYLYSVKENGQRVDIFKKYEYVPVDMKMLKKAKLLVQIRLLAAPVIIGQIGSIVICVLDPDKTGTSIWSLHVWIPTFIAIVLFLYRTTKNYLSCVK